MLKMNKEDKLVYLKSRLNIAKTRGKYVDCPGVIQKLERQIRKLEG